MIGAESTAYVHGVMCGQSCVVRLGGCHMAAAVTAAVGVADCDLAPRSAAIFLLYVEGSSSDHLAGETTGAVVVAAGLGPVKLKSLLRRMRGATSVHRYNSTHTHCEAILTHTEIQPRSTCSSITHNSALLVLCSTGSAVPGQCCMISC